MAAPTPPAILSKKYPAKAHAKRVVDYIAAKGRTSVKQGVLYLESAKSRMNEDNDQESPFRQRRNFFYMTGCELADSAVVYDVAKDKMTLFVPPVVDDEVVWSGLPVQKDDGMKKYDVDDILTTDQVNHFLSGPSTPKTAVYAIANRVSDEVTFLAFDEKDMESLKEALDECRVIKDDYELALMRYANDASKVAHLAVMKAAKKAKTESELEGLFLQNCFAAGCRKQAYDSIVAAGTDASTLHYVHNNKPLDGHLNILLDAGGEYRCYAADITRTFPISGKFTKESRAIYELVLKMQKDCIKAMKEGVSWDDVHILAHKIATSGLKDLGILKGDVEELFKERISTAFLPHGLGHYLGMDTHDTGGHPNYQDPDVMFRYLRKRGSLPAGSVITVEPGVYFCRFIIQPFLDNPEKSKFIDQGVLDQYWQVGGVRIEDNVVITKDGVENLTTVPKEVEELEQLISAA